jgi:hypothetical protein
MTDSFTDESGVSSTFNPTDSISELIVDGEFNGVIELQASRPDADVFITILKVVSQNNYVREVHTLHTPDAAIDYRVNAVNITGTANVYFGHL